jgi:hypothetical protein
LGARFLRPALKEEDGEPDEQRLQAGGEQQAAQLVRAAQRRSPSKAWVRPPLGSLG